MSFEKLNPLNWVDDYTLKARLMPVFIPCIPFLFYMIFKLGILKELETSKLLIAFVMSVILGLSYKSRDLGKILENKKIKENGKHPTTIMLSFADSRIDTYTKKRYHQFLNNHKSELKLPQNIDEEINDNDSLEKYDSAVNWLRFRANGNQKLYPLVYKELVKYGFSRNLLGIKIYCLFLYSICLVWEILSIKNFGILNLVKQPYPEYVGFGVFLLFFIWILTHNIKNVKSNAEAYARALLSTCEEL